MIASHYTDRRLFILSFITICFSRVALPSYVAAQDVPRKLVLEEDVTWSAPVGFAPTRISLCPADRTLLYSPQSREFVLLDKDFSPLLRASVPPNSLPLAMIVTEHDELVTITNDPPALNRFSGSGEVLNIDYIPVHGQVVDAMYTPALGWAALLSTPESTLMVALRAPATDHWTLLPVDPTATSSEQPMHVTLTPTEVLLTVVRSPHTVYSVRRIGGQVTTFHQSDPSSSAASRDTASGAIPTAPWISLPTLSLDGGYLQTLSDTGSDRRIFVRYDQNGVEVDRRSIGVPLAFSAATTDGEKGLLWGGRQLNDLEIVRYKWRWTQAGDAPHHQSLSTTYD